jgi:Holliday junction resolvase RusA-like endonuclease
MKNGIKLQPEQKQTILGVCPSKSNCYRIVKHGQIASLAKTKALSDYEKSFYLQCNHYRNAGIVGLFEIYIDVYYPSNRSDLDNSLKVVLDCLQKVGAIPNDNKCIKILAQKFTDKTNPRIEFKIIEI